MFCPSSVRACGFLSDRSLLRPALNPAHRAHQATQCHAHRPGRLPPVVKIAISGIAFLHAKLLTIHTSRKVLTKTGLEQPLLTYIHYIYTYIYIHGRPYIRFGLKGDYNHGTAESTFMYHVVPTVQLFRTERKRKLMRLILHGAPRTRVLYLLAYI